MTTEYFAIEAMGTELREFSASYVHECFLNGSGVVRVQYPSGDVEYIAGTRYDPAPLRWRHRTNDGAAEVISTDLVLREFARTSTFVTRLPRISNTKPSTEATSRCPGE